MLWMRKRLLDIKIFWRKLSTEKGSTTIFTVIIMTSLVALVVMFVTLSKMKAETGRVDAILSLSSRSALSEYCKPLKERYGLIAWDTSPYEIEKNLRFYVKENDRSLTVEDFDIQTSGFSLADADNLENEITDYALFLLGKELLNKEDNPTSTREDDRVLRNKRIISALPSGGENGSDFSLSQIVDAMKDIDEIFDKTKKTVAVNEYLMKMCNNHVNDDGESFFKNEAEYLIFGEMSDKDNYSKMKNRLRIIRNAVNLATIFSTPELNSKVLAVASAAGPGSGVAAALIAEAWALLEGENDIKILENGGKIPIIKTKSTWATDIESIASGLGEGYIDNDSETGMDYEDYLRVLLYFTDRQVKLERFADIVQINIQGTYDESFLMKTACTGFAYSVKVNGREYKYDEMY